MRVLHVTPYYAPAYAFGGVPRAVEGLARAQAVAGYEVRVLTTDALDASNRFSGPAEEVRDGISVVRTKNLSVWLRGHANLSTPRGFNAPEHVTWADVVHCHEFRTTENLIITPEAVKQNVPLVLSPHGTLTYTAGRSTLKAVWDRLFSRAMARRFGVVLALAEAEADDARDLWRRLGVTGAHFEVVPNGVDAATFANVSGGAALRARYNLGDGPICLYLGRLHPRKGVDVLARAFMRYEDPTARLLIVGPDEGLRPALNALAARDARIVLTGFLDGADRLAALDAATVLALPAVGEGLPMTVLEAMAAGVPVIISPQCNMPEVDAAGAGLIVAVDEAKLYFALMTILQTPTLQGRMGRAAQQLTHVRYNWQVITNNIGEIYIRN